MKKIIPPPTDLNSPRYTFPPYLPREKALLYATKLMKSLTKTSNDYLNAETDEAATSALDELAMRTDLLAAVLTHLQNLERAQ
ncbi:hypothetical protein E2H86_06570 [Pseudomonas putida]|uniref:hypothetical protein n=1 Tax=Pseudomonas putida group TaxID=136845 RepID=UPI00105A0DC3|nr:MULTISPECIES: hypothetical protein [Pseudomonas putida group]MBF8746476.1 hypothetical protein [Pseudomonas monteilii]TDJ77626.1 hypothetical protein E2H86_06570 [Pseudomonas putida]